MIVSRLQSFIHTHKRNKKFIEPENHRMYLGSIGADSVQVQVWVWYGDSEIFEKVRCGCGRILCAC